MNVCFKREGQMANLKHPLVALLAEASPQIGTGHVVEIFSIARTAVRHGIPVELWVNQDAPKELLEFAPCHVGVTDNFLNESLQQLAKTLRHQGCFLAITSFRRVTDSQIDALRQERIIVVCIDELGNTELDCNLVINPSIVTEYHRYTSKTPQFRVCAGPQYMPLSEQYGGLHQQPRLFTAGIQNIVIAMGGIDRSGATLRIIESLFDWRRDVTKHLVVGAGFAHMAKLESKLNTVQNAGFVIYQKLSSLSDLLTLSDVGFTAGGNTLCELACVGTPAVILFEDPHERKQGLAFQERGFGICLGSGTDVTKEQIWSTLDMLESPKRRQAMCDVGRSLVDGRGAERILTSILEFIGYDSPIQTPS